MKIVLAPGLGLGNRLHAMAAMHYIGQKIGWDKIDFVWSESSYCPGKFNDLFTVKDSYHQVSDQPFANRFRALPTICLQTCQEKTSIDVNGESEIFLRSWRAEVLARKMLNGTPVSTRSEILKMYLATVAPVVDVQQEIDRFRKEHPVLSLGIHARRTDLNMKPSNEDLMKLVEKCPGKTYLATDSAATQMLFKEKYPEKVIFYKSIGEKSSLRETTLVHAMIDMWLLAECKKIIPSHASSFSAVSVALMEMKGKSR